MANGDYGCFGKGSTGYAQYMTAFNRNFGGSSGGGGGHNNGGGDGSGCGCLIAIAVVVVLVLLGMGSCGHPHSTRLLAANGRKNFIEKALDPDVAS